jgi:hypothetical protein
MAATMMNAAEIAKVAAVAPQAGKRNIGCSKNVFMRQLDTSLGLHERLGSASRQSREVFPRRVQFLGPKKIGPE